MNNKVILMAAMALSVTAAQAEALKPISNVKPKQTAPRVTAAAPAPKHVLQPVKSGTSAGVQTIMSDYGENHSISVSSKFPNIIMTPFVKPRVVGTNDGYNVGTNGSSIIVEVSGKKPAWLSITDFNNPTGTPISLTLKPSAALGSQTVVISLGNKSVADKANTPAAGGENTYVGNINTVFRDIVQQRIPQGYSVRPLSRAPALASGMSAKGVEMYSSYENDVYRYRVTNTTSTPQVLTEEQFGQSNRVMGVLIFPKHNLRPGESTDVMVMLGKQQGQ